MIPEFLSQFLHAHQEILWLLCLALDLGFALLLYRLFGAAGLYGCIILSILLANLQGPKLTVVFGMETSLGVIIYSGIYFATDLLSEKYGRSVAERAVRLSFLISVLMTILLQLGLEFRPTPMAGTSEFAGRMHEAMETLFTMTPRFVFGSLLAYLISQSFDVWAFDRIRRATGGRHLWLRNNGSTMMSQAVDTLIYAFVVWWPLVDAATALQLAASKYLLKLLIAALDTPFIYWARTFEPASRKPFIN